MVRSVTFEIRWHDTQPIYSCSFQPLPPNHLRRVLDHNMGQAAGLAPGKGLSEIESTSTFTPVASSSKLTQPPVMAGGQSWRLATAGGDNNARIWMVHPNIPSPAAMASAAAVSGSTVVAPHPPRVEYLATLQRHSGVVNVVRFCPKGELLATAGDDGNVLFWVPSDRSKPGFGDVITTLEGESQFEKEFWRVKLMCRATQQELYDMAWSPNGETLAVGGTDFVARIINVQDGHVIREISEHNHYVQGIAWDPLNEFIATQSSDRTVHVHNLQTRRHDRDRDANAAATSLDSSITSSQLVSKNAKLDLHRRNGSAGGLVWDPHYSKPALPRRTSSHASQASDGEGTRESFVASLRGRSKRGSTPIDFAHTSAAVVRASTPSAAAVTSVASTSSAAVAPLAGRASTPTPAASVPPSPFSANSAAVAAHAMNPPQTTPSRRSSFSGSNFDLGSPPTSTTSLAPASTLGGSHSVKPAAGAAELGLSVTGGAAPSDAGRRAGSVSRSASRTRSIRSPSPIPPLPAIRAPPSPKQRMQAAAASGLGGPLAKASMRLYGDENFSGFFRRLSFSPDGGLLVTPSGIFDPPPPPASPTVNISPRKSPATLNPASAAAQTQPSTSPQLGPANKSAVYLYARGNLARSNAPIAVLPGHKTATLVVRFSPILYELRKTPRSSSAAEDDAGIAPHPTIPLEAGKQKTVSLQTESSKAVFSPQLGSTPSKDASLPTASPSLSDKTSPQMPRQDARSPPRGISVIGLPYRMVYAVATQDSVWIYDTQQTGPICCFSNMHYASFTDLTWSPDGQTLMMSSTDGYCSVVVFDYAELGVPYALSAQPALKAPAPGVPAPAHIAEGKSTGSAPNTPKMASPAMLAPAAAASAGAGIGSAAEAYAWAIASASGAGSGSTPAGLGLAMPTQSAAPTTTAAVSESTPSDSEAPKKKRRIALTLERPLGS
ncbi:related to CAC2-component of the chromatin assembly complex [Sporisorium reilianum f. sp. reilianum]|uniref:Related to CAC2-component of the chromatin assembly complex n=1 Tax=Sporisorium reilianum f. sp. reilianum TaxID=72559 RepID=A0A2N8UMM7_9BASI|nr:related to CAC2-component of the chromatin assembly complex [Sporisorium reilianum f. sp. reilianum]